MLTGKAVLITGSSRGIGAATARKIVEYGGKVVLHGRSESEDVLAISKELSMPYVIADVTNNDQVNDAVNKALKLGPINGLVTCAGITNPHTFLETPDSEWEELHNTNVLGPFVLLER